MKRIFDIIISISLIAILIVPILFIYTIVALSSKGPVIYYSERVGKNNKNFRMPKFRSMYTNTPEVATHLLTDSSTYITPIGKILRKTSMDELPQLFTVLKGDMSIVGPRPALFNQYDLIDMRTNRGVHQLKPGITGWAQVNGRDDLVNTDKVNLDEYYFLNRSTLMDFKIIFKTITSVIGKEGIKH